MAEFYAIITNFGNAPKASARFDVSVDTTLGVGIDVLYNVYDTNGAQLAEFTSRCNNMGLATSSAIATNDLFKLTGGAPGLVRARTPDGAPTASALLHQSGPGNRLDLNVPPTRRRDGVPFAMGTSFSIALGDVPTPALLIANLNGQDVSADVFRGSRGADGAGAFTTPRIAANALWRVDLTDADKNTNLVVHSSGLVIVQLVFDDGQRVSALTCLPSV